MSICHKSFIRVKPPAATGLYYDYNRILMCKCLQVRTLIKNVNLVQIEHGMF